MGLILKEGEILTTRFGESLSDAYGVVSTFRMYDEISKYVEFYFDIYRNKTAFIEKATPLNRFIIRVSNMPIEGHPIDPENPELGNRGAYDIYFARDVMNSSSNQWEKAYEFLMTQPDPMKMDDIVSEGESVELVADSWMFEEI